MDLTPSIISFDFQPDRLVKTPRGVVFFDSGSRQLGLWASDSVEIRTSFGSHGSDLFDPVDITGSQLDIFVLDQSAHKIIQFDAALNFIQDISLDDETIYPSQMAMDTRRNFYLYSTETNEIRHSGGLSGQLNLFLDLSSNMDGGTCVSDMAINQRDELALLMSCKAQVHIHARSGRLTRRYSVAVNEPIRILPINQSWIVVDEEGMIQVLGSNPIQLPLEDQIVKDAIVVNNMVWVLSDKGITIYDLVTSL